MYSFKVFFHDSNVFLYFMQCEIERMHKINDILPLKITTDVPLRNEQKSRAALVKQQLKVNTTISSSSEQSVI